MKIAVVTGASSGMGREFVRQVDAAEVFDEIWVIARRRDRLEELVGQTRAAVRPIALDLTDVSAFETYRALLEQEKPQVAVLANISGFGRFGAFEGISLEDDCGMIDLNVRALTAITKLTLPYMSEGGCIYQWDSVAGHQPVPYIGVYAATKAYVLSFSRALGVELKKRGIRVMAVCPFWTKTEFFDRAVTDETITYYSVMYRSEDIVTRALRDMRRGKTVSIYGFVAGAQCLMTKLLPHRFIMWVWCRQQKK